MIPGLGRSLGEGHGNPLWYSCLENPMDRGAWWATVQGVTKNWTTEATEQGWGAASRAGGGKEYIFLAVKNPPANAEGKRDAV